MLALWLIALWLVFCRITRLPWRIAGGVLGAFWLALVALQAVAPGSRLAQLMGGSAMGWLVLGGAVALIVAYRRLLRVLRQRAVPDEVAPVVPDVLSEAELDRYAR
ncbi:MAG: molybdopterin biosynthesis protein, partial [Pararhodobacter sp.]